MTYLLTETGKFVSQEHNRVAEMIKGYSADLDLVWIPPDKRDFDETFPFAILHSPEGKAPYIVRKIRLIDMNEQLIAWLYHSDHITDINAWQDAEDFAKKAYKEKLTAEQLAEKADFVESVLNGNNYYRHQGRVYS